MTGLCAWFRLDAYLDGWAYNHLPELESFLPAKGPTGDGGGGGLD